MRKVLCLVLTVLIAIGITSCSVKPFEPLVLDELWNVIEYFDFENADEDDWRKLLQDAFELLEEAEKELKDAGGNEYSVEWYKDDLEAMGLCQEKYSEAKENGDIKEMQRYQIQISAYKEDLNSDENRVVAQLIAVRELFYEILKYINFNYPDILQDLDFLD